jgi:hypothetical protein
MSNVRNQVAPAGVIGDDPVKVPGVQSDPVVKTWTRARDNAERDRGDCGIHAQEMSEDLICIPTAVVGFAEIGDGGDL